MARLLRRTATAVLDSGPVVALAGIAAVGSFTHIRDLAAAHGQHGWMAWAVAICVDLLCVMAARERHRDKRTHRPRRGWVSWPTLVLAGGVILTLAANLARAEPTGWGYVVAGTPAAAFLVAISMLERRANHHTHTAEDGRPEGKQNRDEPRQGVVRAEDEDQDEARPVDLTPVPASRVAPAHTGNGASPHPSPAGSPAVSSPTDGGARPAAALVEYARHVAGEYLRAQGRPITRDQLRSRLRVSTDVATALLREIRTE